MAEKKGIFAKIGKALLIGGGTVLSLFAPAIGAPLIVAGSAINTGGSVDKLAGYAANLETAKQQAAAMSLAGNLTSGNFINRILANPLPWLIGVVAGLFLFKKFIK